MDETVLLLENKIKNENVFYIGTNAPLASFPGLFSLGMRLVRESRLSIVLQFIPSSNSVPISLALLMSCRTHRFSLHTPPSFPMVLFLPLLPLFPLLPLLPPHFFFPSPHSLPFLPHSLPFLPHSPPSFPPFPLSLSPPSNSPLS